MTANAELLFNINDVVKVRLTEYGRHLWNAHHQSMCREFPGVRMPNIENRIVDGWYTDQLWNVMRIFGPHVFNGSKNVFDTKIRIPYKKETEGNGQESSNQL